mgnify:FL=1
MKPELGFFMLKTFQTNVTIKRKQMASAFLLSKKEGNMTNKEIYDIARKQSAIDIGCSAEDFLKQENKVVISKKNPRARKYLELPFFCSLVSYGNNIVAAVDERAAELAGDYINKYSIEQCFETPCLHVLEKSLAPFGMKICFMAEYFLPDVNVLRELPCPYEVRMLKPKDFEGLYLPQWSNALCEKRKQLDVLAAGAFYHGELIGLAGCSADCEEMYQIGIDVLPKYRRQGVASALTSKLALEILALGKVPFYCAAWSNIKSVNNAIKCGFRPAWVELTAKPEAFVWQMTLRE